MATLAGESEYVTLSTLKGEYRLIAPWVARLGPPDKTASNPYYRCASPMRLNLREHWEEYETKRLIPYARSVRIARDRRTELTG